MVYSYRSALVDQTERALWSVKNVMDCIPDTLWERPYCGMPLWKHLYHMLHSLDQWFINPEVYTDPPFHLPGLNDLDTPSPTPLSRQTLEDYFETVANKIRGYLASLREEDLLCCPPHSGDSRFLLILGPAPAPAYPSRSAHGLHHSGNRQVAQGAGPARRLPHTNL